MAKGKMLEALINIAGHVDPSLQKSLKEASKETSAFAKTAKVTGAAIKTSFAVGAAGIAAVTAATVKAVDAAADYQTAFAKTSTLLKDGTDFKAYSDSIISLSNKTGVAAEELTETVYSAISAGVDQAEAVEFAGTAAKLAAGGFTDSATAVDVMTTALNAYGKESGLTADTVSNLLITTQNLGKTTVGELASSVGKVIPIASAYGVEMDNLSAAYAQLTAGGIATAEAGTYLKSMLNELGDSGSTVTEVLKKQTGKSFAELTAEGKSLGDVMAILGESVGGDAGAFNELWSSSEAGVGALSLLNGGADAYNATLEEMRSQTDATDKAYGTMTDTFEHQIEVIKNLGQNALISIGSEVLPYVSKAAEQMIPLLTDAINGLLPVIGNVMESVGPSLQKLGDKLLPVITDLVGDMGGAIEEFAPFAIDMFTELTDIVADMLPIISQIAKTVLPIVKQIMEAVFSVIQQLMPLLLTIIQQILPVLQELITALSPVITIILNTLTPIISLISQLITTLLPPIVSIIQTLMPILQTVIGIISTGLTAALQVLTPIIEGIISLVGTIADVFGSAFEAAVGVIKGPINAIIGMVNGIISAINGIGFTIPDWVPVIGGKGFTIDIPQIPMLATGGFTDGVSIAGEAGTEAVISFDAAYRNQNLSYWAKAGEMLGVDSDGIDDLVTGNTTNNSSVTEYNLGGVTFAPNVNVAGGSDKQSVIEGIREAEKEFFDMLDEWWNGRGDDDYDPVYS